MHRRHARAPRARVAPNPAALEGVSTREAPFAHARTSPRESWVIRGHPQWVSAAAREWEIYSPGLRSVMPRRGVAKKASLRERAPRAMRPTAVPCVGGALSTETLS